jgi:hypothetical protein
MTPTSQHEDLQTDAIMGEKAASTARRVRITAVLPEPWKLVMATVDRSNAAGGSPHSASRRDTMSATWDSLTLLPLSQAVTRLRRRAFSARPGSASRNA